MLHTTFRLLRRKNACIESYRHFSRAMGGVGKYGEDTPISLTKVCEVCGIRDALWSLRAVLPAEQGARDRLARILACDYAAGKDDHILRLFESIFPLDKRPREAIAVSRRFALGEATLRELAAAAAASAAALSAAAGRAAWAAWAAWATTWAAEAAVSTTAEAATWTADWAAERVWQVERFNLVLGAEDD